LTLQTVWLGLEYFCNEGDEFWARSDGALAAIAAEEMRRIGALDSGDVLDSVVLRVPKAYPSYHGTFDQFQTVRSWTDSISNLFLIGRNGMHRYNNMDHSMLTAMTAVECAMEGHGSKDRIWAVNTEPDGHEFD
jgi:protoporphyrinogen oxidase